MAYDKNVWACGDEITAEKLNHMEDGIAEGSDHGYECTESRTLLTEETVATVAGQMPDPSGGLTYNQFIDIDTLLVTFNGTEYICEKRTDSGINTYGAPMTGTSIDFSTVPFVLQSASFPIPDPNVIITEEAGTYSIKIEAVSLSVDTTLCFEKAVKKVVPPLKYVKDYSSNGGVVENAVARNIASGDASHAEGNGTTASGDNSHAEGDVTTASGFSSHAEGGVTTASGFSSHAEGNGTTASGDNSHAQNSGTIAQGESQTVIGSNNVAQGTAESHTNTDYVFIIGNGSDDYNRSNALAIKWDGTFVFANGTEISPAQFTALLGLLS